MILTTTAGIDGYEIKAYKGVAAGHVICGAHIGRDMLAGITDVVGGRSTAYEKVIRKAYDQALNELRGEVQAMGGNAAVGLLVDYEAMTVKRTMLMVTATATAVVIEPQRRPFERAEDSE